MKKTLIIMLVAVFGLGVGETQAQLDFGVIGGLNVSKVNVKAPGHSFRENNRSGWFFGPKVEVTAPLVGLGVDVALEYSQRYLNADQCVNQTLKTIEIPINLRWQYGFSSVAALFITTGPQWGFNVGDGRFRTIWNTEYKVKNSFMTWNIGAGFKVLKHFEVGLAYNICLTKIARYIGTQEESLKTNSFQAHFGYFF